MSNEKSIPYLNYEDFSVEDFASDHDFVKWVKTPGASDNIFWEQWLKEHPHKRALIEEARALVQAVQFMENPHARRTVGPLWERIQATNTRIQEETLSVLGQEPVIRRSQYAAWKLAAAFVSILMVCSVLLYVFRDQKVRDYSTAYGETKEITLPDGSSVVLNANSTLRLGEHWDTHREVWLEGEAYFSVQKKLNPNKPDERIKFTVHTLALDVNVVGTEFTVSDRSKTTVVLTSGQIIITLPSGNDEKIVMAPGDLVEVVRGEKSYIHKSVNTERYTAWTNHEWILDGLSQEEVAERLTETFGLPVEMPGKTFIVKSTEVTGVVPTDDLDVLLSALSTAFNCKFVREKDKIVIKENFKIYKSGVQEEVSSAGEDKGGKEDSVPANLPEQK